jgi:hypothetical protein
MIPAGPNTGNHPRAMKKHLLTFAALLLLTRLVPAATQIDLIGPPGSGEFGRSVTVLPNGNFVVTDFRFDQLNPPLTDVGATFLYSPEGALISRLTGSAAFDRVGDGGVFTLANGNFVVVSTSCDNGAINSAGAATWGSAVTGFRGGPDTVVSAANSIMGGTANDQVGRNEFFSGPVSFDRPGVIAQKNGNYLVCSLSWDNPSPAAANAGAVTWCDGNTGGVGLITAGNSLVGTKLDDKVGNLVTVLPNGNYVVGSPVRDNGTAVDAGAVTWGSGATGVVGAVSIANSLLGTTTGDQVGFGGIIALPNGHFVVLSGLWRNGSVVNAGAATWGDGSRGITGVVSDANSLVGTSFNDQVSAHLSGEGLIVLANGNYLIQSPEWNNGTTTKVGAVTWADGTKGITGPVSEANSLIGALSDERLADTTRTLVLTNGNYVVFSRSILGGAATWGDGKIGVTGPVTAANSLFGSLDGSVPGPSAATALANGHYVVQSQFWNNGGPTAIGAATWCDGTKGARGPITPANSLIGSTANDRVGGSVAALTNGNYVVASSAWDNGGAADVGAATWANGKTGLRGVVSASNSLIGSTPGDRVGSATALTNGHYVVGSPAWINNGIPNAGAATWGNGVTGIRGIVSPANSLVGSSSFDSVGFVTALPNGNYIVRTNGWRNGAIVNAGAVTWGSGIGGVSGPVSAANSLVGKTANNEVGFRVTITASSHYIVDSPDWDADAPLVTNVGATSLGNGATGTTGEVGKANSVLGTVASRDFNIPFGFDPVRNQMIVGRRQSNLVTLFRGDRLRSLAKTNLDAPGAAEIAFAKPGTAAVNPAGAALTDHSLTGSGSIGKNRALFAHSPTNGTDLVLQTGTALSNLGGGLPANSTATTLFGQVFNRANLGLFQATVKGTGITTANNRLLLLDNGASVQLLHRTGTPIGVGSLTTATVASFTEVLQSHTQDLVTLNYKLKPGTGVTTSNDTGLLLLDHAGNVSPNITAREGETAFGGGGSFGQFGSQVTASIGNIIHFVAPFKPASAAAVPALFQMQADGSASSRIAKAGDIPPDDLSTTFSTFASVTSMNGGFCLAKATLAGSPITNNEGLWSMPTNFLLVRKGADIGGGVKIARILRFWSTDLNQVLLQVQLSGTGVKATNNQALVLRQTDNTFLILLRTGFPAPGTGQAKLAAISAIDVNPISGSYAVLGTLSGATPTTNQALWTGNPRLGNNIPAFQILRLPQLTLRKGNPYSTESTPNSIIRSIALKPALDPTGSGGRGLAQALGELGDLALFITTDRNLTELVLLDR